jgi:hypothetical protein
MRRTILTVALGFTSLAALRMFDEDLAANQLAAARRPDVVIVLTDQQRADAFGAAGATDVRTPTMDRLARGGSRVHAGLRRDAAVFAVEGRASDRTPSAPDRGHGEHGH